MGALLLLHDGVPPKLYQASAGAVPGDGADRLSGGGFPADGGRSTAVQFATARPLSGRRNVRAWLTDGDGTTGGAVGPAVRDALSGSGKPPVGEASRTRTALSVHFSLLSRFGCDQP